MKKLVLLSFALIAFGISEGNAQTLQNFFDEADAIFGTYVSNGNVDYKAIKANPAQLNSALDLAKGLRVSTSNPKAYQAFWINAYNLAVIKGIINNYPLKSPLDKQGFFDKTTYDLGGTSLSLNAIENEKLRANFDDTRFHFVLVCGAKVVRL